MEHKHTPGPWSAARQVTNYRSGAKTLCVVRVRQDGIPPTISQIIGIDDGPANTCLIAAAPDLLEALLQIEGLALR
jgi:hypothetical protein